MKRSSEFLPLSPLQKGLLFHSEFEDSGVDVYALQVVVDLRGPLDVPMLREAAEALLRRHSNLRACFRHRKSGEPVQVVPASVELEWSEVDLTGGGDGDLVRITDEDRVRRFDLTRPPLSRFTVLTSAPDQHRLLWTVHHILADGWSMPILMRELITLYAGGCDVDALPEVRPYRDYLGWLAGQDVTAAQDAWRSALAGVVEPTRVSALAATQPVLPETVTVRLPRALSAELADRARGLGLTLNTVVQGAWAMLLGRLTGRRDVLFGAVNSGRPAELDGIESMVGLFANTLPVRVVLDPARSFAETLETLQAQQFGLTAHQHLGLVEVQQLAGIGELFDTVVMFQSYPMDSASLGFGTGDRAVRVEDADIRNATGFPLSLTAFPGDCVELRLQHRPDAFTTADAERILARLGLLLSAFAVDPAQLLGRIDVLDDVERDLVLRDWNATAADFGTELLPALLSERARCHPNSIALRCGTTELTYKELEVRANRLATELIARGAGPERIVAIALSRSIDLVIAALAVLKAGAAYLPIDPDHPADRIAYMFADAAPVLLLTTGDVLAGLGEAASLPALLLDGPSTMDNRASRPVVELSPDHPAYVIYTSGSTGRPKGVTVTQHGLTNLIQDMRVRLEVTAADRLLSVTTFGFDISNLELFVPLLAGATLVLAERELVRDTAAMSTAITTSGATIMQATPSLWQSLVAADPAPLSGLRVVSGGEALPEPLAASLLAAGCDLSNYYGPTETTIWSTAARLDGTRPGAPSIGVPISNTQVYVLDDALRPVAPGLLGELYLAGDGVARGYLNRFALTSERFVANPYGLPGARMYRTGDVVSWGADGKLDYLGRVDHQVKVRGFRIELGEIESVLADHPQVVHAAAVAREYGPGDVRLVGYVVPATGGVDRTSLRAHLEGALPEYMVPPVLVELDEFPMTPSGKIDRKALPEPGSAALVGGRADRTPAEEILCGLFADVLKLPSIGVDDDFFELGGHSLLATRLISRARVALGVELAVRALFEARTPAALAARLGDAGTTRPALLARPRPDAVPLSSGQLRLWFVNKLGDGRGTYNIPLAIRLSGTLDVEAARAALTDVVTRHEVLRTVFPAVDGMPYQAVLDPAQGVPSLRVADVDVTDPADLEARLVEEADTRFDLEEGLALRARLFRLSADEHVLLLVVHHIIGDGWSIMPLARDFAIAYDARLDGDAPRWDALPVQYADYTLWQDELLGNADDPDSVLTRQLDFWRSELADLPDQLALPADFPRPVVTTHQGASATFTLTPRLHQALTDLARENEASLFMVIQAVLATLLGKLGAGSDIPLGSAIAGRTDEALHDLVGLFVNTLILRTDTSGDPTFRELVHRVRERNLAAYAHQDLPFERVVEALNPERSLSREALFQVALVFQNYERPTLGLTGITGHVEPIKSVSAKFDLTFQLDEHTEHGLPAGLDGLLEYSTDLFTRATAESIVDRFVGLLETVVTGSDSKLSDLNVLTEPERELVTREWAGPFAESNPSTMTALFEAQVAAAPDAPAVSFHGTELSYRELNERANRLAALLIQQGVVAEDYVGIAMPRCPEMVVAVLGVLKAGAAFMPIDPEYPSDRIAYMVGDANPREILAVKSTAERVTLPGRVEPIVVDDPATVADLAAHNDSHTGVEVKTANTAYIIYTSGSTGRPKGVVITHASVTDLVAAVLVNIGVNRILQFSSLSFDAVIWEFSGTVLCGGTLVLVDAEARTGPALAEVLRAERVSFMIIPPIVLASMPPDCVIPGHVSIAVAGEACAPEVVERWSAGRRLVNLYGPTEATVASTISDQLVPGGRPPIGRPIGEHRVSVLDRYLRPVPIGVVGELYVSGGLARGYLNRPDLTADRFVADPAGAPGGRMYRSGDLVRWRLDGQLDFLGRADQQVKIRGFRIELGEIEAVIANHPEVTSVVLLAREDVPGDKRLVAYVVPTGPAELAAGLGASITAFVGDRLPHYMVPAAVVVLDEFPANPNGKTDRKRLPVPELDLSGDRAPRNTVEEILCGVFAEVLGTASAGIDTDFFAAGGNSIRSIQVVDRAAKAGVRFSVAEMFVNKTVEALAAIAEIDGQVTGVTSHLRGAERKIAGLDAFATVLPIRPSGDLPPLFCVHSGLGLSLPYVGLVEHLDPRRPVYGIQAPHISTGTPLHTDFSALAAEYLGHIRDVQPEGPYHLFGWSFGGLMAHELAVQLEAEGERVAYLAAIDSFPAGADDEEYDDQELLARFLDNAGYDRSDFAVAELTTTSVLDVLRRDGSLFASLGEERLPRLLASMNAHTRLAQGFTPGEFSGDLELFVATAGASEAELAARVRRWDSHVSGAVTRYDIDSDHDHLMHPAPQAQIGAKTALVLDCTVLENIQSGS
ncbi:MAG: hypothetical protein JWQ81_7422 [Amycolatopsis sp.]|uniref:amino acid adenylation domain-containing protein n=1 Tax=Amycolatopsis sp. TaxID=37632 RepID=UPI002621B123|nr:non-ribosomal peptide synthetase [Amycolatopsis sp.]MCU1686683.1 hypothetical protein [Amycolatopsis sp.]